MRAYACVNVCACVCVCACVRVSSVCLSVWGIRYHKGGGHGLECMPLLGVHECEVCMGGGG